MTLDSHLDCRAAVLETSQQQAIETLARLQPEAAEAQKQFQVIYENRQELANWDLNLSQFDNAHRSGLDNFTDMNTAFNGYVVQDATKTLGLSKTYLADFIEANKQALSALVNVKVELLTKVSLADQGILELENGFRKMQADPERHEAFSKARNQAKEYIGDAYAAAQEGNGKEIARSVQGAGTLTVEMQQILLQPVSSSTTGATKPRDEEYRQRLVEDVAKQSTTAEALYKEYGDVVPSFQYSYQSALDHVVAAQSDLINRDTVAAQSKLVELNASIEEMGELVEQYKIDFAIISPQIKQLRKQFGELALNRHKFVKLASANKTSDKDLKDFNATCEKADGWIKHAESCVTTGRIIGANQAIANSEESLKMLEEDVATLKWASVVSTAETKEEAVEVLEWAIKGVRDDLDKFSNWRDEFRDTEQIQIFEKMYTQTSNYLEKSQALFEQEKHREAETALEDTRIALDGLKPIYEVGLNTAAKMKGYQQEVQELKDKIHNLLSRGNNFPDSDHKAEFLMRRKTAGDTVLQAETLLSEGKTKDARTRIADLTVTIDELEKFAATPPKRKRFKRRGAKKETREAAADKGHTDDAKVQRWDEMQNWFTEADQERAKTLLSDLNSQSVTDQHKVKSFEQLQEFTGAEYGQKFKVTKTDQQHIYSLLDFELKFDVKDIKPKYVEDELESDILKEGKKPPNEHGQQFKADFDRKTDETFIADKVPVKKDCTLEEFSEKLSKVYSEAQRTAIFAVCHQGFVGLLCGRMLCLGSTHELQFDIKKTEKGDVRIHIEFEKDIASITDADRLESVQQQV